MIDTTVTPDALPVPLDGRLEAYLWLLRADIFLPSYTDHDSGDLERKQDPVEDIILTDEEIASMFPQ